MMDPQIVAEQIGICVNDWPGNCFHIASQMVKHNVVKGKAVYGHYHGFIDPNSIFGSRSFTHHGWVVTDNNIIDPTRWVFEGINPYIYIGPKDDDTYDMGGNRVRKMFMVSAPAFVKEQTGYEIPEDLKEFARVMLDYSGSVVCAQQVCWLASLPLDMLGDNAEKLYRWVVDDLKMSGFIPIDNRNVILGNEP